MANTKIMLSHVTRLMSLCVFSLLFMTTESAATLIYVDTPTNGRVAVDVQLDNPVGDIKLGLEKLTSIPLNEQVLEFKTTVMEDNSNLDSYNVGTNSVVTLTRSRVSLLSFPVLSIMFACSLVIICIIRLSRNLSDKTDQRRSVPVPH